MHPGVDEYLQREADDPDNGCGEADAGRGEPETAGEVEPATMGFRGRAGRGQEGEGDGVEGGGVEGEEELGEEGEEDVAGVDFAEFGALMGLWFGARGAAADADAASVVVGGVVVDVEGFVVRVFS